MGGGEIMTLIGTNFGTTPTILIGHRTCTLITKNSNNLNIVKSENKTKENDNKNKNNPHTTITCTMPEGGGEKNLPVIVSNNDLSQGTLLNAVSYASPILSTIKGRLGGTSGGNQIYIQGSNFGFQSNFSANLIDVSTSSNNKRRALLAIDSAATHACEMSIQSSNHTSAI